VLAGRRPSVPVGLGADPPSTYMSMPPLTAHTCPQSWQRSQDLPIAERIRCGSVHSTAAWQREGVGIWVLLRVARLQTLQVHALPCHALLRVAGVPLEEADPA